ncbi:unnamed protein product, partial [Clonostachys byssicola]
LNVETLVEVLGCQEALFEWAESYDTKDWDRLAKCIAETLKIDYTSITGKKWDALPAAEFVQMASSPHFLGNPLVRTQHFVGGAKKWRKLGENKIMSQQQMRVAHLKYANDSLKSVQHVGHAHGMSTVYYEKANGIWKFAGIEPGIRWAEGEIDKIFH